MGTMCSETPVLTSPNVCITAGIVERGFIVKQVLGKGCFSTVYSAIHIASGQYVALKVIDRRKSDKRMVDTEIDALTVLNGSSNVIELYDVFNTEVAHVLVLQLCTKGNLHNNIVRHGVVDYIQALKWYMQLLVAVDTTHRMGVINRDIKNANCLIDENGDLRLADFGLAVIFPDVYTAQLDTSTGSLVFASPEVFSAKRAPYNGPKSEVWACAAVLHSMLTGSLPFPHAAYSSNWKVYHPPSNAPLIIQDLLTQCFAFDPNDRPDIVDILNSDALHQLFEDSGGAYPVLETRNFEQFYAHQHFQQHQQHIITHQVPEVTQVDVEHAPSIRRMSLQTAAVQKPRRRSSTLPVQYTSELISANYVYA
eukprot:CFRG3814T1